MAWPDELTLFGIMTWWNGLTGWGRLTALIFVSGFVFLVARLIRGTSSGEPISKLIKIREQAKACHRALVELETRAGIAEAAEKLRPLTYLFQREKENTTRRERLRELYFTVRDEKSRKQLIAKHREGESLTLNYWQHDFSNVLAQLKTARSRGTHWTVGASIYGIIFLALGFHFFGQVGALGGLLVAYFNGRRMEDEAHREHESATADAELYSRDAEEAEQYWNEVRNRPSTFSQREAETGERDTDGRLRAV
jgi:hypothetical protein